MKDLDKIKEALAREAERNSPNPFSVSWAAIEARDADHALLLAAVPDLLKEINGRGAEIVKALAEIDRLKQALRKASLDLATAPADRCSSVAANVADDLREALES